MTDIVCSDPIRLLLGSKALFARCPAIRAHSSESILEIQNQRTGMTKQLARRMRNGHGGQLFTPACVSSETCGSNYISEHELHLIKGFVQIDVIKETI